MLITLTFIYNKDHNIQRKKIKRMVNKDNKLPEANLNASMIVSKIIYNCTNHMAKYYPGIKNKLMLFCLAFILNKKLLPI